MPKMSNPFADVESGAPQRPAEAPQGGAWNSGGGQPPMEASAYAQAPKAGGPNPSADIARREAELAAKAAELEKREAALKGVKVKPKKNWPVCCPLTHHDIATDIPADLRAMVRLLYTCYLALVVCLVYNFFAASVVLGERTQNKLASWFMAVIYMLVGIPLAFILWYKRLYNAASSDRALSYMAFFILFGIHTAFCIWAAIAVPFSKNSWSFAGFVTAIQAFDLKAYIGIIYIVVILCVAKAILAQTGTQTQLKVYSTFRGNKTDTKLKGEVASAVIQAHATGRV